MAAQEDLLAVGLMSGSSLDGLDLTAVRLHFDAEGTSYELVTAATEAWSPEWQARLAALSEASAADYAKTHVDFAHACGLALRRFLVGQGLQPDVVASHGHTVFHQPHRHFTAQIGCGQTLATYADCPVVTDFRPRDVAEGGEGAPLVPFGELHLFPAYRLFLNLGGIANLSILQREGAPTLNLMSRLRHPPRYLACDLCPLNQLFNALARRHDPNLAYDPEGTIARSGRVLPELLAALDALPFYALLPPRSLGREWVENEVWPLIEAAKATPADLLRTCVEHAVGQIAAECQRQGLHNEALLVTGGGAHNAFLIESLSEQLALRGLRVDVPETQLVDYKEALVFAFLGACTLRGQPNHLPDATGARRAAVLGAVHLPVGWRVERPAPPALQPDLLR